MARHAHVLLVGLGLAAVATWLGLRSNSGGDAGAVAEPGGHPVRVAPSPEPIEGGRASVAREGTPAVLGQLPMQGEGHVDLEVLGLPEELGELEAQVFRPNPWRPGNRLLGPRSVLPARGGRAAGRVLVPATERIHFVLQGPGVRASTEDEPLELEDGEVRILTVDLSALCVVRGRLVDVPTAAGRAVTLLHGGREGTSAPLPTHPLLMQLSTRVDADGAFTFGGVPRGAFILELRTARGTVPLVDARGQGAWIACAEPALEVRPGEPLVGLAPVDELGAPLVGEAFAVIPNEGPGSEALLHPGGIALVKLAEVRDPRRIGVHLPRRGVYLRDPAAPEPAAGALVGIPVGEGAAPSGSIRVIGATPLAEGLIVDFEHHGPTGPSRLLGLQVADLRRGSGALRMERLADGARLVGLPAGTYDLFWSWGGRRAFAADVEVALGEETVVRADAPRILEIDVRLARWEVMPEELRPIELLLEGASSPVREGRARLKAAEPFPHELRVRGKQDFWWPELQRLVGEGDGYRIDPPFERFARLALIVEPLLGGRIVAEIDQDPSIVALDRAYAKPRWVQPAADGRPLLVFEPDDPPAGLVWEFGPGLKLLRGWFDLAAGSTAQPALDSGRWCDLQFELRGSLVEVHLEGPARPGRSAPSALVATVDSSLPARIWIPDGTRALTARERTGREGRFEFGAPPDVLEIRFAE